MEQHGVSREVSFTTTTTGRLYLQIGRNTTSGSASMKVKSIVHPDGRPFKLVTQDTYIDLCVEESEMTDEMKEKYM